MAMIQFPNINGTYQKYPDSPLFKAPWVELPPNFKRDQQVVDAEVEERAKAEAESDARIEAWVKEERKALRKKAIGILHKKSSILQHKK
jgi:hypothetical protein